MTPLVGCLLAFLSADPPPKDFVGPPAPEQRSVEADDPQSIRMRIDHNMRASEEQLKRRNVNDEARRLQGEVLRDIDRLLTLINRPPQSSPNTPPPANAPPSNPPPDGQASPDEKPSNQRDGPGGSGQRSNQSSGSDRPKPGGGSAGRDRQPGEQTPNTRAPGGESRRERRARAGQSSDHARGNPQPAPGALGSTERQPGTPGARPGDAKGNPGNNADAATGATMSPGNNDGPDRLADMSRDVWGHLPDTLRQEVDHYYRERFMPRYREMLQQYYSRLAESERREKERK